MSRYPGWRGHFVTPCRFQKWKGLPDAGVIHEMAADDADDADKNTRAFYRRDRRGRRPLITRSVCSPARGYAHKLQRRRKPPGLIGFPFGCDLHCELLPFGTRLPRVCAVSYLNTTPLVWGMLHGPQRDLFDLEFAIPAVCADRLACGGADIGIVPSFELTRQNLETIPGAGIA